MAKSTLEASAAKERFIKTLTEAGFGQAAAYTLAEDSRAMAQTDRRKDMQDLEDRLDSQFDALGQDIRLVGDRVESLKAVIAAQGEHFAREMTTMREVQASQAKDFRGMLAQESEARAADTQSLRETISRETANLRDVLAQESKARAADTENLRETISRETANLRDLLARESKARAADTENLRETISRETANLRDLLARESKARAADTENLRRAVENESATRSADMRLVSRRIDGVISQQHQSLSRLLWGLVTAAILGLLALMSEEVWNIFE